MSWFGKKEAPVRNDQVRKLLKLGMRATDAGEKRGPDVSLGGREHRKADALYAAAIRESTMKEREASTEALRRHGY